MKPKNFPERKRQRRLKAFARLDARNNPRAAKELARLLDLTRGGSTRGRRTKKDRSAAGRLAR